METNIVKIKEISEEKAEENWAFRLMDVIANCSVCPIVFNVYEALKEELWHKESLYFGEWLSEEEE